jgi:hypothetical protein
MPRAKRWVSSSEEPKPHLHAETAAALEADLGQMHFDAAIE